jgi:mRNA interferase MazF
LTNPSKISQPTRGDVWVVRLDPVQGAEIDKTRPAIVVNPDEIGCLPLRIITPVTGWDPKYVAHPWLIPMKANQKNGLTKDSAVDCFQVKSVSLSRFVSKIGIVRADELEEISAAIALCVGAP